MMGAERLGERDVRARVAELAARLRPGDVVFLSGPLGAGKTTCVDAICRARGGRRATSPTFALVNEYETPGGLIVHVDCYRFRSVDEVMDLDLEAALTIGAIVLIEWPERALPRLPAPRFRVRLDYAERDDERMIEITDESTVPRD